MKKVVFLLLIVLVMLFIAGCSKQEQTEINVVFPSMFYPDSMVKIAGDFEKKSGIKVNFHFLDYGSLYSRIVHSVESEEPVYDICSLDLVWTREFAEKNYCLDLTSGISPFADDINPAVLEAFTYNDKVYAMPFILDFQMMFYNMDFLQKAGFQAPPETLEQMVEQMKVIKAKGILRYPWLESWSQTDLMCEYVWLTAAFGGDTFDAHGKPLFNKGAGLKALKFMKMLLDEGLVDPSSLTAGDVMVQEAFMNNQSAFNSNWFHVSNLVQDPAVSEVVEVSRPGLLPVSQEAPGRFRGNGICISGFEGFAVLANTKVKEAAWEFIKYAGSRKNQEAYFSIFPVWNSVRRKQEKKGGDSYVKVKSQLLEGVYHRPKIVNYAGSSEILQKYIYKALEGTLSPEEALDSAVKEIELVTGSAKSISG